MPSAPWCPATDIEDLQECTSCALCPSFLNEGPGPQKSSALAARTVGASGQQGALVQRFPGLQAGCRTAPDQVPGPAAHCIKQSYDYEEPAARPRVKTAWSAPVAAVAQLMDPGGGGKVSWAAGAVAGYDVLWQH